MAIAQPKTKLDEILDQLRPFASNRTKIDQMTLARLKRELERNAAVDFHMYHMLKGMLAVTEWDLETLHTSFDKALRIHNNFVTNTHYATALQLLGKFDDACVYARTASELCPTDLAALERAESFAFIAGEFSLGEKCSSELRLRAPDRKTMFDAAMSSVINSLKANGLDEGIVKDCNKLAFDFLREKQIPYESTRFENDTLDNSVMFSILLYPEQDGIDDLDAELGELLFEKIPNFHPGRYWVGLELGSSVE